MTTCVTNCKKRWGRLNEITAKMGLIVVNTRTKYLYLVTLIQLASKYIVLKQIYMLNQQSWDHDLVLFYFSATALVSIWVIITIITDLVKGVVDTHNLSNKCIS